MENSAGRGEGARSFAFGRSHFGIRWPPPPLRDPTDNFARAMGQRPEGAQGAPAPFRSAASAAGPSQRQTPATYPYNFAAPALQNGGMHIMDFISLSDKLT
jgi:hypothetical protein